MTPDSIVVCLDIYDWLTRASESGTHDTGKNRPSVHRLYIKNMTSILVFVDDHAIGSRSSFPLILKLNFETPSFQGY